MKDNEESLKIRICNYQQKTIKRKTGRKNKRAKTMFYMKTWTIGLKAPEQGMRESHLWRL